MATTPRTLTQGRPAEADEVFYPETDGMPLPDGFEQGPHFREIVSIVELHVAGPTTAVSGDTFVYYVEGDPRKWVSPDCYVAFGVDVESIRRFNTYRVWEVGKAPDFVLEIGSPSTASNDIGPKRDLYASLGVREYWRFDPTGGDHYGEPLVGENLVDGEYRRFETMERAGRRGLQGHSPLLDLDLCWREGRLRFYEPAAGQAGWRTTPRPRCAPNLRFRAGKRPRVCPGYNLRSSRGRAGSGAATAARRIGIHSSPRLHTPPCSKGTALVGLMPAGFLQACRERLAMECIDGHGVDVLRL